MSKTGKARQGIVLTGWLVACSPAALPAAAGPSPASAPPAPPMATVSAAPPPSLEAKTAAASCHHDAPVGCASTPPSFNEDVQPLLVKRCFRCHTGDGPAADEHDFSKKDVVFNQRKDILGEIATCSMPPKAPLDDAESKTLLNWAACAQGIR